MSTNFITPWQYFQLVAPGQQNIRKNVVGKLTWRKKGIQVPIYIMQKRREQMEEKKPPASGVEIQGL